MANFGNCRTNPYGGGYIALAVIIFFSRALLLSAARSSPESSDVGLKGENNGCSSTKATWTSKGFGSHSIPTSPIPGDHLEICSSAGHVTCCTQQMEAKLSTSGRQAFNSSVTDRVNVLRQFLVTRSSRFDALCTDLIDKSSRELHEMFVRTYGLLYEQNAAIFTTLFTNLRSYYRGADLDVSDAMDSFFANLALKMFVLLNTQYAIDERYMQCVRTSIDGLAPFGDVPQQLAVQVKRAFVAARTFHQGLAIGRDVVAAVSKIEPTASCLRAMTRMLFCPYCQGLTSSIRPCNDYCMNVMRGCMAYQSELNDAWNAYLDQLLKVAGRLEGPFNIENVIQPINVKISDAIMNLQENGESISNKIFQGCGQPTLSGARTRRHISQNGNNDEDYDDHLDLDRDDHFLGARSVTANDGSMGSLIQEIHGQLTTMQDFWKNLPHSVCSGIAAPLNELSNCWNGLSISRYMSALVANGLSSQINNPEVEVDTRKPNTVVSQQILQLKLVTNKLKNAYNGLSVDWIDIADDSDDGSGSGDMFSGSGDKDFDGEFDGDFDVSVPVPTVKHHGNAGHLSSSSSAATRPPVVVVTQRRPHATASPPTSTAAVVMQSGPLSLAVVLVATLTVALRWHWR